MIPVRKMRLQTMQRKRIFRFNFNFHETKKTEAFCFGFLYLCWLLYCFG